MYTIYKFLILSFGVLLLLTGIFSCENILDKQPLDKISDEAVWTDIALMNAYVIETYAAVKQPSDNYFLYSTVSDESFARERTNSHLVQRGEISPSNLGYLSYAWPTYYGIITRSNLFLSNINSRDYSSLSTSEQELLNVLTGEMKFHRARAYFRLASLFDGVPLVTEPFSLGDEFSLQRDSYETIMDFVIKELDEASDLLPLQRSSSDRGRLTRGAAMGIKARALLYAASPLNNPGNEMSRWQAAADAAKAVIDLGLYELYPDYGELFREEANFNNEVIWERVIMNASIGVTGIERAFYPNGFGGFAVCVPTQRQVEAYETKNGLYIGDDPSYRFDRFWENRDPRFYATILYDGAPFRGREIETFMPDGEDSFGGSIGPWNSSYTGYYSRKFVQEFIQGSPGGSDGVTSSPNWPYLRYAEILLIYAEAEYHLGNEDVAREYVNLIRSRPSVDMPPITDSGDDLMRRIKNEYQVEFYLEERRFFNIRRWKEKFPENDFLQKMNVEKDPSTGNKTYYLSNVIEWKLPERTYHCPIPLNEITRNPNLEQNPGYN